VTADPAPDDMSLASDSLWTISECGAAITRPGHLKDAASSLYPLDAQAGPEAAASPQIVYEVMDRFHKRGALVGAQPGQIPPEAFLPLKGGHLLTVAVESSQELLCGSEVGGAASSYRFIDLALALLPFRRPEPRLICSPAAARGSPRECLLQFPCRLERRSRRGGPSRVNCDPGWHYDQPSFAWWAGEASSTAASYLSAVV
jgi:hypothetical protein